METLGSREVYTVSEITSEIKRSLEGFGIVWIQGEISNFKHHSSGHMYFSLKDQRAQIKAAFFRNNNLFLKFRPEDGLEVVVRGRISVYEPRGDYQAIVEYMEPVGVGSLQLAFEQLKKKLSQEGLFDAECKKPLPLLPDKVGIITSSTGAALRDMLRVLQRRNASLHVLIYPARVQGAGAAEEIAAGVRYFNTRTDIDVMIVGRGGGSMEDLWAFNEEVVARAIHASGVPVISAVGHETDFTIADFVADLRAPTPSSAAELVSGAREDLLSKVRSLSRRALQAWRLLLGQSRGSLQRLTGRPAFLVAPNKVRELQQRFDEAASRMEGGVRRFLTAQVHRAEVLRTRLVKADLRRGIGVWRQMLARRRQELLAGLKLAAQCRRARVEVAVGRLHALSPLAILERGYAICRDDSGTILKNASRSRIGDGVAVRLARGELRCRIDQVIVEDGNGTQGEGL